MLTPIFELVDQDGSLRIIIKAPYSKVNEAEVHIEQNEFRFYSKPYFLRLNLPGSLVENGNEEAKYDADSGQYTFIIPKENPDEKFDGLDMLTKLLAPINRKAACGQSIEVIADETSQPLDGEQETEEEIDWQIEQNIPEDEEISITAPKYGFGNLKSGVFTKIQEELGYVIDLKDVESVPSSDRATLRWQHENLQFSEDHYLADLFQNETVPEFISYVTPWQDIIRQRLELEDAENKIHFTTEEKEQLLKLPRKDYLLDKSSRHSCLLSLVDIMFAYAYNYRTTMGDYTSESVWTIAKLSGTLSWLQSYASLKEVVLTSFRRSLCYPLYRHWGLAEAVLQDVVQIISLGRKYILKVLLEIHRTFICGDSFYIFNDLYITDYCVWIQTVRNKHIGSLENALRKVELTKTDVDFEIELIEQAGMLAIEDEKNMTESLTSNLTALRVNSDSESDTDSDESCDSESTESSSSRDEEASNCPLQASVIDSEPLRANPRSGIDGDVTEMVHDSSPNTVEMRHSTDCRVPEKETQTEKTPIVTPNLVAQNPDPEKIVHDSATLNF